MPQRDDRALLDSLAAGDRAAAEELVERSYRMIYASLYRLTGGDAELSADLTQETYRKAWAALDGFDRRSRFSTWLYRIAYNTFLNHIRRPRPLVPLEGEAEEEPGAAGVLEDSAPGPEESLGSARLADRLRRAVLALPEDLRFTVSARYWGDRSVSQIADELGLTTVAIRKRLKRANERLALTLEGSS